METIFRFNTAADLNEQFLSALKTLFQDNEIEISVRTYSDETEYLLKEPENKVFLNNAIQDLNNEKNLVNISGNDYDTLVKDLLKK